MHKDDCIWTEPNRCNCGWLQDIAKNPCEAVREIDRLRAELARKAEGYTRLAEVHEGAMKLWESQEREAEMKAYEMAAELKGLREEVERLRHDIERHIAMASELATENEWLRPGERVIAVVPEHCAGSGWANAPTWGKGTAMEQAKYLEVEAGVRYWEDATVNGVEDTDGKLMPMRKGDCWAPVIRLADGMVMDWPQGTTADVHFKVCDAGEYWLLDDERKRVAKWAGFYVPDDFLCPADNGYGDYIILNVGADGLIEKWRTPDVRMVCPRNEDDQSGWAAVA